jgi:hypothetical protein
MIRITVLVLAFLSASGCTYSHRVKNNYTERINRYDWTTSPLQPLLEKKIKGEARYIFWFTPGETPTATMRIRNTFDNETSVKDELRKLPFHELFSLQAGEKYAVSVRLVTKRGRGQIFTTVPSVVVPH